MNYPVWIRNSIVSGLVGVAVATPRPAGAQERSDAQEPPLFAAQISQETYDLSFQELSRDGGRSSVLVEMRSTNNAGASSWIACAMVALGQHRGYSHYVQLGVADQEQTEAGITFVMDLGFVDDVDADVPELFGVDRETDWGSMVVSVDEYAEPCASLFDAPAPVSLNGDYILTVQASDACLMLPDERRSRTYPVSLEQTGSLVAGTVLQGDFWSNPVVGRLDSFRGAVNGSEVVLWLQDQGWGLVEVLGPDLLFEIMGVAEGSAQGNMVVGKLRGGISVGENLRDDAVHVTCDATDHRFALTRR
jgi:hypothetical protein